MHLKSETQMSEAFFDQKCYLQGERWLAAAQDANKMRRAFSGLFNLNAAKIAFVCTLHVLSDMNT